jgi:hypothetical protein
MKKLIAVLASLLFPTMVCAQTFSITGTLDGLPGGNYSVSATAVLGSNGI